MKLITPLSSAMRRRVVAALSAVALVATLLPVTPAHAVVTPEILTIGPRSGSTTGGEIVTITGQDFNYVSGSVGHYDSVQFDGVPALLLTRTNTAMTVVAPRNTAGPADVKLITPLLDVVKTDGYLYVTSTITSISPSSGPTSGGTKITIEGIGFGYNDAPSRGDYGPKSSQPTVTVGGVAAVAVTRVSDTKITAVVTAQAAGAKDVVVTVPHNYLGDIVLTKSGGYTYVVSPTAPQIFNISPSKGPTAGNQVVVVNGENLRGSDTVDGTLKIGGVSATVTSVSIDKKTMYATTPAGSVGLVDVEVSTSDGRATLTKGYEYGRAPSISTIVPSTGPENGSTSLVINGDGFGTSGTPTVMIGGVKALCVQRESDALIRVVTPALAQGAVDIAVTPDTGGGIATKSGGFTYAAETSVPTITSITPGRGPVAGGTAITINGTNFGASGTPTVLIDTECATNVVRVSSTQLTAVTPRGIVGLRPVRITTSAGALTAANKFDFTEITKVIQTGVSPEKSEGPTTGGQPVTITGRGFGNPGDTPTVTFAGVAATSVVVVSDTQITAVTPPGTAGAKTVAVTPVGGLLMSKASAFTYKAPTIISVAPGAGVKTGGTTITIVGTGFGFSGTPVVTVGGTAATSVNRISSTELTAVTPAGTVGLVNVVLTPSTGTGSATAVKAFEYLESIRTPLVDDVSPTRGPQAGGTPLTISGDYFKGSNNTPVTVTIGGVTVSNVTVSSDGKTLNFTTPSMGAGWQNLVITTNEGAVIYKYAFWSAPAPSFGGGGGGGGGGGPCDSVSGRDVVYNGSNNVTITGSGFKIAADSPDNPTVSVSDAVGSVAATIVSATDTQIVFTVPNVASGYRSIIVTPATGGGAVTLASCLKVSRYLGVTAGSFSICVGDTTPTFTFLGSGLVGTDSTSTVTYTFTGVDGTTYGPSTTAPTGVGKYKITPSAVVFTSGTASNYTIDYVDGDLLICGVAATVTAEDKEITYGDSLTPTATTEDLTNGDVLNTVSYEYEGKDGTTYAKSSVQPVHVGTYKIIPKLATTTPDGSAKYTFTYVNGTLKINPKPITVTADPQTKVYGSSDPTLTYSISPGLVGSDSLSGSLARNTGEGVANSPYAINRNTLGNLSTDYTITYVGADFTITPKPITVTIDDKSRYYGNSDPTFTYTSAGLIGTDTLVGAAGPGPGSTADVGTYTIAVGTLDGGANYTIESITTGTLTVNKRPITITADDKEITYGDSLGTNSFSVTTGSVVSGDLISNMSYAYSTTTPVNAGEYDITPSAAVFGAGKASNYDITYADGTLTIKKKPVLITADDKTKVYGDSDPTPWTYTSTGLINGDTLSGSLSRDTGENVDEYDITPGTLSAGSNYEVTIESGTLTITPKPLTVTAVAKSKTYGDADPALTYTTSGMIGSDSLSGSLSRDSGSNVGTYTIRQGSLDNSNYDITYVTADLTVDPKSITVTVDDKSKEYGDSDPTFTYSSSGLVGSDTLSGAPSSTHSENRGTYTIGAGTLAGGTNYTITSITTGTLTITKRAITVTADDKSITYGDALPTNGFSITSGSMVSGESLSTASYSYDVTTPANAGEYDITPSAVQFLAGDADNYDITYVDGTLTIDKKPATITADDKSKEYGSTDPALTFATTGFINGDTPSGALTRTTGENVANSPYSITQGTLDNSNYDITFTPGALTITAKPITVTAEAKSKTYGDSDPSFTWLAPDLEDGDTLSGSLSRDTGSNVGTYNITQGTVANANYDITFVGALLTIDPKSITVTIDDKEKEIGDNDPTFTYTAPGLIGGDTLSGSMERVAGETAGTYDINNKDLTASSNYTVTSITKGTLTIKKRAITVTADDKSITYGDALPTNGFTITSGSLLSGDLLSTVSYAYDPTGPQNAGTYAIKPSSAVFGAGVASNYDITYVDGTLTIAKKPATLTASTAEIFYGDPTPTFTFDVSGLISGDSLTGVTFKFDGSTTAPTDPGEYDVEVDPSSVTDAADNYDFTYIDGTFTIVSNAPLALIPIRGTYLGGTPFKILGRGFGPPGTTVIVTFGGLPAISATVEDDSTITGVTPPWELADPELPETVDVEVTLGGKSALLVQAYTYLPPVPVPAVLSIYPPVSPTTGGSTMTLVGKNFVGTDGKIAKVYINGVLATNAVLSPDGKSLTVTIPPGPPDEKFDVEIRTIDGATGFIQIFEYQPPVIDLIVKGYGWTVGGDTITISGNFFGGKRSKVYFGENLAKIISWSNTEIVVESPEGPEGLVDVEVVPFAGPSTATATDAFEYFDPPRGNVTGLLWLDLDKDGNYDKASEPVLPNLEVELTVEEYVFPNLDDLASDSSVGASSVGVSVTRIVERRSVSTQSKTITVKTNDKGIYKAVQIPYGKYLLSYELPPDIIATYEPDGKIDGVLKVTLDRGEVVADAAGTGKSSLKAIVVNTLMVLQPVRKVRVRWWGADRKFDTPDDTLIPATTTKDAIVLFPRNLPGGQFRIEGWDSERRLVIGNVLSVRPNGKLSGEYFILPLSALPNSGSTKSKDMSLIGFSMVLAGALFVVLGSRRRVRLLSTQ